VQLALDMRVRLAADPDLAGIVTARIDAAFLTGAGSLSGNIAALGMRPNHADRRVRFGCRPCRRPPEIHTSLASGLEIGRMHDMDFVAVGIAQIGAVVAVPIMRTWPRSPCIPATVCQSIGVGGVHCCC